MNCCGGGGLSLHHVTVFACQLMRKKYMEINLNCELINAKHSGYKMCTVHKRSRTPNI
jgi:hypothetical protein